MVDRASRAVRDLLGVEHVYSFVFGESVPHLHVHRAPRYPGTPDELCGVGAVGLSEWADGPRGRLPEIEDVCRRLRTALTG